MKYFTYIYILVNNQILMANKVVLGVAAGILAGTKLYELYQEDQINKEQEEEDFNDDVSTVFLFCLVCNW